MTEPTTVSRRPARQGLYGGLVSSRPRKAEDPTSKGPKKPLKPRIILDDAADLVRARKGRLLLGLLLMTFNRLAGLVLPGTTKYLLDDVIGKGNRALLMPIVFAAGAATLLQAVTSFSLAQVLGKAAQRSITEMRRQLQRHVCAPLGGLLRADQGGRPALPGDERRRGHPQPGGHRSGRGRGRHGDGGAGARHPLLSERQADADRARRAVALRLHHEVRLQDSAAAVPRTLQDQRRALGPAHRVVLGGAGGQGLPGGAARGPGLHQGRAPALPQHRPHHDRLLGDRRRLDPPPGHDRHRHDGGGSEGRAGRADDSGRLLRLHPLSRPAGRPGGADRQHRQPVHRGLRRPGAHPGDPQRDSRRTRGNRPASRCPGSTAGSSSGTSGSSTRPTRPCSTASRSRPCPVPRRRWWDPRARARAR